jgi:L-proline amide hydrolase
VREGTVPLQLGGETLQTWFRVTGELREDGPAPLVVLHGGPGAAHDYLLLRALLPPEVEATLRRHEAAGTTDDPEYAEACLVFYARHVCRLDPWPAEVGDAFAWIDRDPTVYHTMNGPSEFHVVGSIRDWHSTDRLASIDVPSLLVSGRHDEATPALQETLRDGIRDAEWVIFEDSSHMPHVEERERYMGVVGDWLARHD